MSKPCLSRGWDCKLRSAPWLSDGRPLPHDVHYSLHPTWPGHQMSQRTLRSQVGIDYHEPGNPRHVSRSITTGDARPIVISIYR
jgi:hypothetical protein